MSCTHAHTHTHTGNWSSIFIFSLLNPFLSSPLSSFHLPLFHPFHSWLCFDYCMYIQSSTALGAGVCRVGCEAVMRKSDEENARSRALLKLAQIYPLTSKNAVLCCVVRCCVVSCSTVVWTCVVLGCILSQFLQDLTFWFLISNDCRYTNYYPLC